MDSKNRWKSSDEDSLNLIKIAKKNRESFIILDDYRVDENYQLNLRKQDLNACNFIILNTLTI